MADPGTCRYVGSDGARDHFRGSHAHNTLTVDELDQAEPKGPFSWGPLPRVEVKRWITGEAFDLFEGCLRLERLPDRVTHRRWVLRLGPKLWLVRDVAEVRGTHRLEIAWHFPPELTAAAADGIVTARGRDESLTLSALRDEAWRLSLAEDGYSPVYGVQLRAPVAHWSYSGACPADFAAAIGFGPEISKATLTRLAPTDGAAGYLYSAEDERRWFFFADAEHDWKAGDWASDAAVLCFRVGPDGARELILAGGSYVEHGGKRIIHAADPQACIECFTSGAGWSVTGTAGISLNPEGLP